MFINVRTRSGASLHFTQNEGLFVSRPMSPKLEARYGLLRIAMGHQGQAVYLR